MTGQRFAASQASNSWVTPQRPPWAASAMILVLAAGLALAFGLFSGLGGLLINAALLSVLVSLAALGSPRLLFWVAALGSLVMAGLLELYLPSLQIMRWAFAASTWLFAVAVVMQLWRPGLDKGLPQPGLTWAVLAFLLVFCISLALNWPGVIGAVSAAKNYFQAWGLFVGLVFMIPWSGFQPSLARTMLVIGLCQFPFALHQFIWLVPKRIAGGLTGVDVVAGTFGASVAGGGNNAVLAMFLIMVTTVLVALWRTGALRARWLWFAPWLLTPVFFNESKVSVLYLLLVFLVVFRREVLQRPLRFVAMSIAIAIAAVGLVLSYTALHQGDHADSPTELIEQVVRQNTEEGEKYGKLLLNRTTSLTHWVEERSRYPWINTIFGHGPSQSKLGSGLLLDAPDNLSSRRYPGMGIGVTTVSSLLWDFGLIGLAAVAAVFVSAFRLAGSLAKRHAANAAAAGFFSGLQACVAVMALSLAHKSFFTFQLGYQVLVLMLLGTLVLSWRWPSAQWPQVDKKARSAP